MPDRSTQPPQELIRHKRDGGAFTPAEIGALVAGIADGGLADAQVGALAMACFLRGLNRDETVALTLAMAGSGERLRWSLDRPVVDKHSTGGVGDKVSLMLAPILAACGAAVPMIAGRGLGHTGGTIDKLESIPGYQIAPDPARFAVTVREVGCAIIGQTARLAPADRRLYAIRDACGAVESIPLITASILAKKLAAGVPSLVMDIKCGSGAFMASRADAEALARSIAEVGRDAGQRVTTVISDMNQVLGRSLGNALEVREAIDYLTGAYREPRLHELTVRLAAEALILTGLATADTAGSMIDAALDRGTAAEHFSRMVAALGGPTDLIQQADSLLPRAPITRPVTAEAGWVTGIDTRQAGLAVAPLGGCRFRPDDRPDLAVGFTAIRGVGEAVGPDQPLAICHARDEASAAAGCAAFKAAFRIGPSVPALPVIKSHVA